LSEQKTITRKQMIMQSATSSRTLAEQLFAATLLLTTVGKALADVHYVYVNSTNATPPYSSWSIRTCLVPF
jgi:hypothetical protein